MNLFKKWIPVLTGTIALIYQLKIAMALTRAEVENKAKEIAVLINKHGKFSKKISFQGSGVIVAKHDETYYVLTAKHVVELEDKYQIVTSDGVAREINYSEIILLGDKNLDLALLPFETTKNYQVATLIQEHQYSLPEIRTPVYLYGWHNASGEPKSRFADGLITNNPSCTSNIQGSECWLVYDNDTYAPMNPQEMGKPGMSGSPLLDENGNLLGIHIRAPRTRGWGGSLGIPISTFWQVAPDRVKEAIDFSN